MTANFLHDSFVHLGVSSYALLTIAPEAEAVLGSFAFLTTYILGGIAGTTICFLLTDSIMVGASSGIFGLIGKICLLKSSEGTMSRGFSFLLNLSPPDGYERKFLAS